jgi:hypothetical protein
LRGPLSVSSRPQHRPKHPVENPSAAELSDGYDLGDRRPQVAERLGVVDPGLGQHAAGVEGVRGSLLDGHADDQIVPIADSAMLSSKIIRGSTLKVYQGAPHGLCSTRKDEINADLLAFIKT